MEYYNVDQDIHTICVRASSFPEGVLAAHQKLHLELFPPAPGRDYFGISYGGENGIINYLAGVSASYDADLAAIGCESFVIRKGKYRCVTIVDFMKNISQIGQAFEELLRDPRLDGNGYCVEMYLPENTVRCMVPISND